MFRSAAQLALVTVSVTLGSTARLLAGNAFALDSGVLPVQVVRFALPLLMSFAFGAATMLPPLLAELLNPFIPIRGSASTDVVFWIRFRGAGWGGVFLILGIVDHEVLFGCCVLI
ncbi:MAG: hypothetical protein C0484_22725 [Rhodospirillum sp.]|nr:hypothetical protein [Rhodospirillum sp.]